MDLLVNDVRKPLTVIHAYAQLLQRRIRQGSIGEEEMLDRLARIEEASQRIEARLHELEGDGH